MTTQTRTPELAIRRVHGEPPYWTVLYTETSHTTERSLGAIVPARASAHLYAAHVNGYLIGHYHTVHDAAKGIQDYCSLLIVEPDLEDEEED